MDKKWVIPSASAVPILAIIYAFSLGPSPHKVLLDFQTLPVSESALVDVDPSEIAPLLITEIADKQMIRRHDAIAYLGKIKSAPAVPVLEAILADETEAPSVRADALGAIASIDPPRGQRHALTYRESPSELGKLAREVLAANPDVVGVLR